MLLIVVAAAHSLLGERYILQRLFTRDNLPKLFGSDDFTKRTLRFAWHITSVAWFGMAALLVSLVHKSPYSEVPYQIIAVTFAVTGLISFIGSRGKHLPWIVFSMIAALVWFSV